MIFGYAIAEIALTPEKKLEVNKNKLEMMNF